MHIEVDNWRVLSRVLENYTEHPKIFTITSKNSSPQQIFLQRDVFTNTYCCPFCGLASNAEKWEQRWEDWEATLKNALETWGSIVVQEIMDFEGQWVEWLHGHKYWMVPKRIFMLSIRDNVIYPVSAADCKAYHELHGQVSYPSEPLVEYVDASAVFAFYKIHHANGHVGKAIRITG